MMAAARYEQTARIRVVVGCVALLLLLGGGAAAQKTVLVTGATGRTGLLLYRALKERGVETRALVRNATKAREVLGCSRCDSSEGIFVGDITQEGTLDEAAKGVDVLAVVTSSTPICMSLAPVPICSYPPGAYPVDVDFKGAMAQVRSFALANGGGAAGHVVLCSAEGTTAPDSFLDTLGNGHISFYKLNFEAFLASSGVPFTIVKPCGLVDTPAGTSELIVGHEDAMEVDPPEMSRGDLARVMLEAALQPEFSKGLRFDLCSRRGAPTEDFRRLFRAARYPWEGLSGRAELGV